MPRRELWDDDVRRWLEARPKGLTVTELSVRLGFSTTTVSRVLRAMEVRNLLKKMYHRGRGFGWGRGSGAWVWTLNG